MPNRVKLLWTGGLMGLACLLWFGCQNANSQLQIDVLESNAFSGNNDRKARFMVISDSSGFADVYARTRSHKLKKPQAPSLDFDKKRVLVAFMGQKSTAGYRITFAETLTRSGDTLVVTVNMQSPPQGAVLAQVITSPYAMATVERGDYTKIRFVDEDGTTLATINMK